MTPNFEFADLILAWRASADATVSAITSRNYRAFRRSIRGGRRIFKLLQKRIFELTHTGELDDFTADLKSATDKWSEIPALIADWKDELDRDRIAARTNKKNNLKLRDSYKLKSIR